MYWNLRRDSIVLFMLTQLVSPIFGGQAEDQYAIAAQHYQHARWQLAADEFDEFLKRFPDHELASGVEFHSGETLVQLGRFEAARERFTDYLQREPGGEHACRAQFRIGEASYLEGDFAAARTALDQFRKANPQHELNEFVFTYLGEIALADEDVAGAREMFSAGLKAYPDGALSNQCRFGLARAMEALGDFDAATRFYRFLSETANPSPYSDDALLHLAILQYERSQFGESTKTLQRFCREHPGSTLLGHASYWLGISQTATGDFLDAAITLSTAAERHADHVLVSAMSFAAGEAYREAADLANAQTCYQQVIDQWPACDWADDSLQALVDLAWANGEHARVCELGERFVAEFPGSELEPLVTQTLARALIKLERYPQAIELLETATDVLPATAESTANEYYLAVAYLGAERHQDAIDALARIKSVTEPSELVNGIHVARAAALMALEKYSPAIEPLEAYLTDQPDGPDAAKCWSQLVIALARLQRWSDVSRVYDTMHARYTADPAYLSTVEFLAEAAYGQDQRDMAQVLFQDLARAGNPPDDVARGLSGLAWLEWNREGGAAESAATFERLLIQFPDSPLAAEAAVMRGQSLEKTGRPEAALAMYRLVIDRYDGSSHLPVAMLSAARIHDQLQQDQDAESLLRRLVAEFPHHEQHSAALYELAWVLVDLGRDVEADEVFQRIHSECRQSDYWVDATYRLAERAAVSKDFARADRLAESIIQADCDGRMMSHALYLRGQLAASAGRWEDVAVWMPQLVRQFPNSALRIQAEYWLAEALYRQHEYTRAGEIFDRLESQTGGRSDTWLGMISLRRAQVLAHAKRWHDAAKITETIADRFPDFPRKYEADYLLGRYFASMADFEQARQKFQQVIESSDGAGTETAAMAQWMIGETYFLQEKFDLAIKAYHRTEGLYDYPRWQAAALLQAGKCHEMMGHWTEAIELYSQILQDLPTTRFAAKAANRLRVARQRADIYQSR